MRSLSFAFCMIAVASTALAQQDVASARPADDCYTTLRAGSGSTYTKVCISSTGNVTSYESHAGVEHIRVLDPIEGYRICRYDGWAPMYDTGSDEYGFDEPNGTPAIYQPNGRNTLPLRITRLGFNGLEIIQEFFFTAHSYGPAELKVIMRVSNTGTVTLPSVRVQRFFDGDINGRLSNHAFVTRSTALMMIPGGDTQTNTSFRGLSLSAGVLDKPHWANQVSFNTLRSFAESGEPTECGAGDPQFAEGANPADKAGVLTYSVGDVLPGRRKSVSFLYRRF